MSFTKQPVSFLRNFIGLITRIIQHLLVIILAPFPPRPSSRVGRPKIAIIGAGISGITAAAHCIGHGFDVTIFEAGRKENIGGIWTRANGAAGLLLFSQAYPFHPLTKSPHKDALDKQQIISQVRELWERYGLDHKTRFNVKVNSIVRDEGGRWLINNAANGRFEGVIAAVGACGETKALHIAGLDKFKGKVYHGTQLHAKQVKNKKVVVIGDGVDALSTLEFAVEEAAATLSVLSERGPAEQPLPMSQEAKEYFQQAKAEWLRCDIRDFTEKGVVVNQRDETVPTGAAGRQKFIEADILVMATGFHRPSLSFFPLECYELSNGPANWFMQTFPPADPTLAALNCTYASPIGAAGHKHIAVFTRMLLMFLVDAQTRPSLPQAQKCTAVTLALRALLPVSGFDTVSYFEMLWWIVLCIVLHPRRWKWMFFVFFGLDFMLPQKAAKAVKSTMSNGSGISSDAESHHLGSFGGPWW